MKYSLSLSRKHYINQNFKSNDLPLADLKEAYTNLEGALKAYKNNGGIENPNARKIFIQTVEKLKNESVHLKKLFDKNRGIGYGFTTFFKGISNGSLGESNRYIADRYEKIAKYIIEGFEWFPDLPLEVKQNIIKYFNPKTLANFSQASKVSYAESERILCETKLKHIYGIMDSEKPVKECNTLSTNFGTKYKQADFKFLIQKGYTLDQASRFLINIYQQCPTAEGLLSIGIIKDNSGIDAIKAVAKEAKNLCIKYLMFFEGYEFNNAAAEFAENISYDIPKISRMVALAYGLSKKEAQEITSQIKSAHPYLGGFINRKYFDDNLVLRLEVLCKYKDHGLKAADMKIFYIMEPIQQEAIYFLVNLGYDIKRVIQAVSELSVQEAWGMTIGLSEAEVKEITYQVKDSYPHIYKRDYEKIYDEYMYTNNIEDVYKQMYQNTLNYHFKVRAKLLAKYKNQGLRVNDLRNITYREINSYEAYDEPIEDTVEGLKDNISKMLVQSN